MDLAGRIVELYSDAELERLRKKIRTWSVAAAAVLAGGIIACTVMAALTTTGNAERMELSAVATSVATGWVTIYCCYFAVGTARREYLHAVMLRTEERVRTEGDIKVTGERIAIRRSITARRVEIAGPEGGARMLVTERKAAELGACGAVAVYSAHGYIAAYEVAG